MAEPTPFREEEGNTDCRDDSSQERAQNYGIGSAPVGSVCRGAFLHCRTFSSPAPRLPHVAAPASLFLQHRNRIHPRGGGQRWSSLLRQ
jgi:hypothetical protein